ncbi:MAG: hypothetical protein IAG10_26930 [Planctomycetaceae bacterium]|nr:hypothetical protein [Planctomycetaceae bacterium]
MTTNESAERVAASSERGQEHDAELIRIVAAWDELPAVLKGAMLAIVDSIQQRTGFGAAEGCTSGDDAAVLLKSSEQV